MLKIRQSRDINLDILISIRISENFYREMEVSIVFDDVFKI